MTRERWEDLVGNVKDKFKVEEEGSKHDDEQGGVDIEFIVFSGPLGRIKLEFISRPVVLDKKTNYSNRIGSETQVKYVYSETEKNSRLTAYKWDESKDDWIEINGSMFAD